MKISGGIYGLAPVGTDCFTFNRETHEFERLKIGGIEFNGHNQTVISAIIEVGNTIWIGSEDAGIAIYDHMKQQLTPFLEREMHSELNSQFISSLLADGDSQRQHWLA
jgi:hypothetical protein